MNVENQSTRSFFLPGHSTAPAGRPSHLARWACAALTCGLLSGTASAQGFSFDGNTLLVDGNFPIATFPVDFNSDGAMDFIGLERNSGRITLFLSDGADEPAFSQLELAFGANNTRTMFVADIDNDGDPDIVVGTRTSQRVRWLRNNDGTSVTSSLIFAGADGIASVYADDFDGDGDIDVASASQSDNTVRWHENDGASDPAWTTHVIDDQALGAFSIFGGDWEGDGDIDLFTACEEENTIRAHFNTGNPGSNFNSVIFRDNVNDPRSVFVSDMDGDGDNDLLFGAFDDDEIRYIRNNGPGNPLNIRTVTSNADGVIATFVADMDGDGDNDVLSAELNGDRFRWFENDGTDDPGWSARTIANSVDGARSIFPVDIDADGDTDILTAETGNNTFCWYENDNGMPLEARNVSAGTDHNSISEAISNASVSDILRSGFTQFVSESSIDFRGKGVHLESTTSILQPPSGVLTLADNATLGSSDVARSVRIGPNEIPLAIGAHTVDLLGETVTPPGAFSMIETGAFTAHTDSQITLDFGSSLFVDAEGGARFNAPVNLSPNATLGTSHDLVLAAAGDYATEDVSSAAGNPEFVIVADLDGDGDTDVISSGPGDGGGGNVRWHEHNGAANPTFTDQFIFEGTSGPRAIVAMDMDSDGDIDVVSVSQAADSVYWHENDGAADPAFTSNLVSDVDDGVRGVDAADLDGDGDFDIVTASQNDNAIRWHESDGAADPTFTTIDIATDALLARSVYAADVDGDGDIDVLATSFDDFTVRWYENDGDAEPTFTENVIDSTVRSAWTIIASDIDSDGDLDMLTVSGTDDLIIWYENDGAVDPSFTRHDILDNADGARTVHAADMDGDGDTDILSMSFGDNTLRLHENDGASDPTFTVRELDTTINNGFGVFAADLDSDGDLDALTTSQGDGVIHWHENLSEGMDLTAGATLTAGSVLSAVSLTLEGGAIVADGVFENNAWLTGFGDVFADTTNNGAVTTTADLQHVGDYTNNATTTIQNGTLTILGALTNNGTIVGDFASTRSGEPGGMFTESSYTAGTDASLKFPGGGLVSMGGDYDVAIDRHSSYDMADAELRMVGVAGAQSLEVMSVDIGPDRDGLDRTLGGHFPIGTLRVGPTATTVDLVDFHDNDGLGQVDCEVIYVRDLHIDSGATLNTNGCVIYYDSLVNNGSVDAPANLIPLPDSCAADLTGNGVVNSADLAELLSAWSQSGPADFTGDGIVDAADLAVLLAAWGPCI